MKIGFIGTGIMGSRMAAHLQAAGHDITVYNRTQAKAAGLIATGATWAATPADAARGADVVITMLAHPQAVELAATSPDGLLSTMPENAIWVDSSTVNPMFARRMATVATAQGVRFLDAPVAGSKPQAQDAQLVFFVGGDEATLDEVRPLFETMGRGVNHVGEHGMGNALKLVINHLLATSMAAFAEGMVLGEALGISQERLLNTLLNVPVTPAYLAGKRPMFESGDYEAQFPLQWMQKDTQMVAEAAFDAGVAMPLANATKEAYQLAARYGYAEQDLAAIYAFLGAEG